MKGVNLNDRVHLKYALVLLGYTYAYTRVDRYTSHMKMYMGNRT